MVFHGWLHPDRTARGGRDRGDPRRPADARDHDGPQAGTDDEMRECPTPSGARLPELRQRPGRRATCDPGRHPDRDRTLLARPDQ